MEGQGDAGRDGMKGWGGGKGWSEGMRDGGMEG